MQQILIECTRVKYPHVAFSIQNRHNSFALLVLYVGMGMVRKQEPAAEFGLAGKWVVSSSN